MSKYEKWAEAHLDVRQRFGDELVLLCPFHDDHDPSMYFNKRSGLWLCHACGARGNAESLQIRLFGEKGPLLPSDSIQDVYDALKRLEEDTGEEVFYEEEFLLYFDFPTDYWRSERRLTEQTIERFRLGFDPFNNEATIPLRDEAGRLLGVIRRRLGELPKGHSRYKYPKGAKMRDLLWGASAVSSRLVYLTEGSIDAMSLWDIGRQAVAVGSSRLTDEQVMVLRRMGVNRVVVFPDNPNVDGAADELVRSTARLVTDIDVRVVDWEDVSRAKDANDLAPVQRALRAENVVTISEWMRLVT